MEKSTSFLIDSTTKKLTKIKAITKENIEISYNGQIILMKMNY